MTNYNSSKRFQLSPYTVLAIVIFLILLVVGCKSEKPKPIVLRSSHLVNEKHTWFQAFNYFGELIEERSGGRLKLENYHSEQLAKEIEAIRLIQAGVIDFATTGSTMNNWLEIAAFCEMPFLLRDTVDMVNLIEGPIGERIKTEMLDKVGLMQMGYFQRGPRHLTSNRPIRHPDDLDGLILRVPAVPSFVTAWEAIGAKPTPMAFSEVFSSLQQGTIEAQENPFAMIHTAGFAEVQDYLNLTSHVVSWVYPVMGAEKFNSLPPDLQEIILVSARDMQRYEHSLFLRNEKTVTDKLKAKGMEFIEVDKNAFAEKCEEAIFKSLSPDMQQVYHQVIEMKLNENR